MDDVIKEVMDSINNDNIYDYIANNYYKMRNEDLKNILLEYIYLAHDNGLDESSVVKCLEERYN